MTPERWQQIRDLLHSAMELKPAERPAYLDRHCSEDPGLREQVNDLLLAEQEVRTDFLESPPLALDHPAIFEVVHRDSGIETASPIGRRLGSYRIVEEIGRGGMGEVFRAFRDDDQYRKQVAVKLVRRGPHSDVVFQRFRNERQILAGLDHPNIARLLDGGATEQGEPYFVMELIQGSPIDQYCDQHSLTTTERLKMFCQVCSAVQYAHQHLTVHRDIKPGNILVTADGIPKLLDFGIAKIVGPTGDYSQVETTLTHFRVLTPRYASPEQLKGETVTTASDLYSLGVVLYELLTGRSPYRSASRTPQEIARAVCEVEPEKLSTTVRRTQSKQEGSESLPATVDEVAALRDGSPEKLSKRLRGDLDNIVLMALRKEPQRRYASVEQFAQDITRHLENLPVIAREDTIGYRTSKFFTRHKAGVSAAALVVFTVLAGMSATLREARIARAERAQADRRFNDVRELASSLVFDIHDSIQNLPGSTPARKMLVDRALKYLDRLASESSGDASLQRELATAYERLATVQGNPFGGNLGDLQGAAANYRKAAVIWDSLSKANPGNIQDLVGLAGTYRQLAGTVANVGGGDPLELVQKAVDISERMGASASADPRIAEELELDYEMAAAIQVRTGADPAGALENHCKALTIAEQRLKGNAQDPPLESRVATIRMRMGDSLAELGRQNEALDSFRLGLEMYRSDPDYAHLHRAVARLQSKRGDVLMMGGDTTAALLSYREVQALLEPLAAADPQNAQVGVELACNYSRIGWALSRGDDESGALAMFERARAMLERLARDSEHTRARWDLAYNHIWMGEFLARTGKMSQALENYREAAADFVAVLTLMPWDRFYQSSLAASHAKAGMMLARMGHPSEAAAEYQTALEIARPLAASKPDVLPWYTIAEACFGMGELLRRAAGRFAADDERRRQDWSEARDWYQHSVEALRHIPNPSVISSAGFTVGDPRQPARSLALSEAELARLTTSRKR
jgi:serine/threonine protein kinase